MNESIFLLFCSIWIILFLEFLWFIQKEESAIFNFVSTIFLLLKKSGYRTVKISLSVIWAAIN